MGLFSRKKEADAREPVPAAVTSAVTRTIRLNFRSVSEEAVRAMASQTLQDGGYVEPAPREPEPGDKMPDGTIYAGISPDTGKPMFAASADAKLTMTFNEAKEYA